MAYNQLLPDILGSYNKGREIGNQNQFSRLAGLALGASGDDQKNYLAQAAQFNPAGALSIENTLADNQLAQQKLQQVQQDAHLKKVNNAALFMKRALDTGNPAAINGAYQSVRPFLAQASGKEPPPTWTPELEQGLYQLLGQSGGMPEEKGVVLTAGGQIRNPSTGALIAENPANPANASLVSVPDGQGGTVQMLFDPRTRQLSQPNYGGAPQGQPDLASINAQAGELVNSGQMTPEQGDAWILQQYANAGASPSIGGLGYTPPNANKSQQSYRPLSEAEARQMGLPKGTSAQIDSNGKVSVLNKPSATDARLQMQAKTAATGLAGTVSQLDRLKQAATDLKNDAGLGGITGLEGMLPNVRGSAATRAAAALNTLRSQVGFGVLQNMREMSKTGGALGSISDRENTLLQDNLASLDTKQSTDDFKKSLDKIIQYADDSKARLQGAYNDTYGDVQAAGKTEQHDVTDLLSKYGVQ